MCGIVYAHSFAGNPVNNLVMQQFDAQRARGTDGFGLYDGQENHIVKHSKEDGILKWLVKYDSNLLMFHHRYPTSTINVKRAAHPFSTGDYFGDTQYVLVHNGVIRNSDELFEEHQELGIEYKSLLQDWEFNDSEALAWDFARYMEGQKKEVTARGAVAFVCVKLVKGKLEKLYFGRNSNPLNMERTDGGIMLSSQGPGEAIERDTLYTWNYQLKRLTKRPLKLPEYASYVYTGTPTTHSVVPRSYDYDYDDDYGDAWYGNLSRSWNANREFTDDSERYDDYWKSKDTKSMGEKLGSYLRTNFAQYFHGDGSPKVKKADYEILDSGIMVPSEAYYKQQADERAQRELEFIERRNELPTTAEVETEKYAYLAAGRGHFDTAIMEAEADYIVMEGQAATPANVRQKVLLDLTIQALDDDEEHIDNTSVSSMWEALWNQQNLV